MVRLAVEKGIAMQSWQPWRSSWTGHWRIACLRPGAYHSRNSKRLLRKRDDSRGRAGLCSFPKHAFTTHVPSARRGQSARRPAAIDGKFQVFLAPFERSGLVRASPSRQPCVRPTRESAGSLESCSPQAVLGSEWSRLPHPTYLRSHHSPTRTLLSSTSPQKVVDRPEACTTPYTYLSLRTPVTKPSIATSLA